MIEARLSVTPPGATLFLCSLRGLVALGWAAIFLGGSPAFGQQAGKPAELRANVGSFAAPGVLRFLEDREHRLTIGDVSDPTAAERFMPVLTTDSAVNFGYSASAFWLALPLRLATDAPLRWLLEVGLSSLDKVDVYAPTSAGGFSRQTAGDLMPFA